MIFAIVQATSALLRSEAEVVQDLAAGAEGLRAAREAEAIPAAALAAEIPAAALADAAGASRKWQSTSRSLSTRLSP